MSVSLSRLPGAVSGVLRRVGALPLYLACFLSWGALAYLVPSSLIAVGGVALALALGHSALSVIALVRSSRLGAEAEEARGPAAFPFVSVHVPIHAEPPALVRRTLDALARVDYPHFEVVVVDNNTPDAALWRPVRAHCAALGRRFRFVHAPRLDGAKAGALRLALRLSDPRTEHVLTVDADYVVRPGVLRSLVARMEAEDVGAVQAPQAYADRHGAPALALSYRQFFRLVMPAAEARGAALLTGTLSLIRVGALREAGGWRSHTITEDADLGLRLTEAGWRVAYAPDVVGEGRMPTDLPALRAQRRRWACGNGQVLRHALLQRLRLGRRWPAVLHQLTFWSLPLALPLVLLATVTLAVIGGSPNPSVGLAASLAAAALGIPLAVRLGTLLVLARRDGLGPREALGAMGVEMALLWEHAVSGLEGLGGACLPFVRTEKTLVPASWQGSGPALTLAVCLTVSGAALLGAGLLSGAVALTAGLGVLAGLVATLRQLRAAAAVPAASSASIPDTGRVPTRLAS